MEIPISENITDLSKVNSQLSELYKRAAGDGASAPTVKATLMNLVTYACNEADAEEAAKSVAEIVGSHPCRAIVIDAMPPQPQEPEASVSVMCSITPRGDRRLCGEIIRVHIHKGGAAVIGAVMPLLLPDVPMALWTPGDIPVDDEEFDELADAADAMIADSRRFSKLRRGMESLVRFCFAGQARCVLHDLAWIALEPWRELTSEHFDPPVHRHYLDEFLEMDIKYAAVEEHEYPPGSPLLFASWFINRLGLEVIGARRADTVEFEIETTRGGRLMMIRLAPESISFAAGQLTAVTIRGGSEGNIGTFITQGVSETEIAIREECRGICFPPKTLDLPAQQGVTLAGQALDSYRRDPLYKDALEIALRILLLIEEGEEPETLNPVLS